MQDKLQTEKSKKKTKSILYSARGLNRRERILYLRDIVVEGDYRASKIERRINCIGDIVPKCIVLRIRGHRYAIPFREIRRVKLSLLGRISNLQGLLGSEFHCRYL